MIFGLLGGGVYCKGIWFEFLEWLLIIVIKEVCFYICNCKEEFVFLKIGEYFISEFVVLGLNKDLLRVFVKLCFFFYDDMCVD